MKKSKDEYYSELARDIGVHEKYIKRGAKELEIYLWLAKDDKNAKKDLEFDVSDSEPITFEKAWKSLSRKQKENLLLIARGEYDKLSEHMLEAHPLLMRGLPVGRMFMEKIPRFRNA